MAFSYPMSGDSFLSVSDADTYHSDRDRDAWADLDTPAKEAALRKATTFLDQHYDWKGDLADTDNAHAWPRKNVEDDEGRTIDKTAIPDRIKDACAELAFIDAVKRELLPATEPGRKSRVKAGSVEIEYAGGSSSGPSLAYVNRIVSGLATSATGTTVVRH